MIRVGNAESLGDHVATWMTACLVDGDGALRNHLLDQAVILRYLAQLPVPQVGTAIADPGDFVMIGGGGRHGDGGTHRSEEHTSELQSLMRNSYAVFCLKKKKQQQKDK